MSPDFDTVSDAWARLKCVVPPCIRAGETSNCPPYSPDLDLIRRTLARFCWAIFPRRAWDPLRITPPGHGTINAEHRQMLSFHKRSREVVYELERQAYKDGFPCAITVGMVYISCS